MGWAELFCAAAALPAPADRDRLEHQLAELVSSAAAAWSTFAMVPEPFLRYVAERLPKVAALDQALASMHATDLYLACACVCGDEAALRELEERYLAVLEPALHRIAPSGQGADVLQLVREKILVRHEDREPKLAEYAGRGSLMRWLRVAALRTALNLRRGEHERPSQGFDLSVVAAPGQDLEFDYIQARFREDFKGAFAAAITTLTKRQHSLLGFHYAEGLTLEQVASVYRVSRATAARWLAGARAQLLAETRRRIAERLDLGHSEVDSMMRLLDSRIDVSLSAILQRES